MNAQMDDAEARFPDSLKSRTTIAAEFGISTKTLRRYLVREGIFLPDGLVQPAEQARIYQFFLGVPYLRKAKTVELQTLPVNATEKGQLRAEHLYENMVSELQKMKQSVLQLEKELSELKNILAKDTQNWLN